MSGQPSALGFSGAGNGFYLSPWQGGKIFLSDFLIGRITGFGAKHTGLPYAPTITDCNDV